MPKAEPHFDAPAVIAEVHKQDFGLRVSTNQPANFRQIMYKFARRLGIRLHIYPDPRSRNSFFLLKQEAPNAAAQDNEG